MMATRAIAASRRSRNRMATAILLTLFAVTPLTSQERSKRFSRLEIEDADLAAAPPRDWVAIDAEEFAEWEHFRQTGELPAAEGALDHCVYVARLVEGQALAGSGEGVLRLIRRPGLVPIGSPSFAIESLTVAEEPAAWGNDARGESHVYCPRDAATLKFRWSQRSAPHDSDLQFDLRWLTATASRLVVTVPVDRTLEVSGGVIVNEQPAEAGWKATTIEFGSRPDAVLRVIAPREPQPNTIDCDLVQTVVASSTKLAIQADLGLQPLASGPWTAEIPIPPEFAVVRVTLPNGDRLPYQRTTGESSRLVVQFPQLESGHQTVFRVALERAIAWIGPQAIPRIAPAGARMLKETWALQAEKPLEFLSVEHPGFLQTGLSDDRSREVWSLEAVRGDGTVQIMAGLPLAKLTAAVLSRLRVASGQGDLASVIHLESRNVGVFEVEVDVDKPWSVVSAEAVRGSTRSAATWEILTESETGRRVRIYLPDSLSPQTPVDVVLKMAAPVSQPDAAPLRSVVAPVAAVATTQWLVAGDGDLAPRTADAAWSAVSASEIPEAARAKLNQLTDQPLASLRVYRATGQAAIEPAADLTATATSTAPAAPGVLPPTASTICVAELRSRWCDAGATEHFHEAVFSLSGICNLAGWTIRFDRPVSIVDVRADGQEIETAVSPQQVTLPAAPVAARSLVVRYRSIASEGWIHASDVVAFPQPPIPVAEWSWRIDAPESRTLAIRRSTAAFVAGIESPSFAQRLLGPMGRGPGQSIFNPFDEDAWNRLARGLRSGSLRSFDAGTANRAPVLQLAGLEYPKDMAVDSWRRSRIDWACWTTLIGSLLTGLVVRKRLPGAYRTVSLSAAIAATGAWLAPGPWPALFGSALGGGLVAFLLPRRFVRRPAPVNPPQFGSSYVLGAASSSMAVLVLCAAAATGALAQTGTAPDVVVPLIAGEPAPFVFVPPRIQAEFQMWQRDHQSPNWLVRRATYTLSAGRDPEVAADMTFELLAIPASGPVTAALPFEGVTFRSSDAAILDGKPIRLTPLAGGKGIAVPLPKAADSDSAPPFHVFPLTLKGQLRASSRGRSLGLDAVVPSSGESRLELKFSEPVPDAVTIDARGLVRQQGGTWMAETGGVRQLAVRWRPDEREATREAPGDGAVSAHAESIAVVEPRFARFRTRLTFDAPETTDPFASEMVSLRLPAGSVVATVTGESLAGWSARPDRESTLVTLNLQSPPLALQSFDIDFTIPLAGALEGVVPPIELLTTGHLGSHEIAFLTTQPFELKIATEPDPGRGIWAVGESEVALSLRRALSLPAPAAGIEIESPQPITFRLTERTILRSAELEQSLAVAADHLGWQADVRVETSGRPALVHEFQVDPAIEIDSASVIQDDVERLIRTIRRGDRLILLLRDDRPGPQRVKLAGRLHVDPNAWARLPTFQLLDARTTRSELIIPTAEIDRISVRNSGGLPATAEAPATVSPGGARSPLRSPDSTLDVKWTPVPVVPLADRFVEVSGDDGRTLKIEWRLAEPFHELRSITATLPDGVLAVEPASSARDVELMVGPLPEGAAGAVLTVTIPDQGSSDHVPGLRGTVVPPGHTWLLAPREWAARHQFSGLRLDQAPVQAPAGWRDGAAMESLAVIQSDDWTPRPTAVAASDAIGDALAESVLLSTGPRMEGLTSLFVDVQRDGDLLVFPPPGGRISAAWLDQEPLLVDDSPESAAVSAHVRGPSLATLVLRWTSSRPTNAWGTWTPSAPRIEGTRLLESTAHIEAPDKVLLAQSMAVRPSANDPTAALRALRNERTYAPAALPGLSADRSFQIVEQVAESDPDAVAMRSSVWQFPRQGLTALLAVLWFVAAWFLLRRVLKLFVRWEVADRVARHPPLALGLLGAIAWLLISPSEVGFAVCLAAVVWQFLPERRSRPRPLLRRA